MKTMSNIKYFIGKLTLLLISVFLLNNCAAGGGTSGSDYTPPATNPNAPFSIKLSVDKTVGQTNVPLYFTAQVLDADGRAIEGTPVTFMNTTNIGSLLSVSPITKENTTKENSVSEALTDQYGKAKIEVVSTTPGYVSIEAYAGGGLMEKRTVYFSSSGGSTLSPLYINIEIDSNDNGEYDELDDYKICQNVDDTEINLRITAYYKGEPISGIDVFTYTDLGYLVEFTDNIYAQYDSTGLLQGCDYYGDGNLQSCDYNFNGVVAEDMIITDEFGKGYTIFKINCALVQLQKTLNIYATTPAYLFEEFPNLYFYGSGATSVFLQPVEVTDVNVTAEPDTLSVSQTSYIEISVDTNLGPATAPDGTIVNISADCKDSDDMTFTDALTTLITENGKVSTIFTTPSVPPIDNKCTLTAEAGGVKGYKEINISSPLLVVPTNLTIDPTEETTTSFVITGGTAPYTATSNRPDLVNLSVSNSATSSVLTVTLLSTPNESTDVTITIEDAKHSIEVVILTIEITPYTINPTSLSFSDPLVGDTQQISVSGGVAPYEVESSNPSIVTASLDGMFINVTIASVPSSSTTVYIRFKDATGNETVINVNITISSSAITASPSNLTFASTAQIGSTQQSVISGGTGPYTVDSSNPAIGATIADNILTVTLQSKPAASTIVYLTVTDSLGETGIVTVTITVTSTLTISPNSFTFSTSSNIGDTQQAVISGGSGTYTVESSNEAIEGTISDNILNVTLQSLPSITTVVYLTVTDSAGNTAIVTVNITVSSTLTVSPSTITFGTTQSPAEVGSSDQLLISGGVEPYSADVSDPSIRADITGNVLTLTIQSEPSSSTVYVTVSDSAGNTAIITVNLVIGSPGITLSPIDGSNSITNPGVGEVKLYNIVGGTGNYTSATSSDTSLLVVDISEDILTATVVAQPLKSTAIQITVTDDQGNTGSTTLTLEVPALTVFPSTATKYPNIGDVTQVFTISGGVPSYTIKSRTVALAYNNNPKSGESSDTWIVSSDGGTFTVTITVGITQSQVATLEITDAAGNQTTATISAQAGGI
ncbi:secreted protein containing Bacterial Ig-like, group 1 domain protein [Candidatus Magnetoovum chiemensis]|nr:secreted protein containing Bacterial Ig-like, group 1 domain protein [Candidatus Magnetoovum chiemensis]